MQLQNLAALAAAASAAQNTPSGTNALTTSSSPLSVLTSSGKGPTGSIVFLGQVLFEGSQGWDVILLGGITNKDSEVLVWVSPPTSPLLFFF